METTFCRISAQIQTIQITMGESVMMCQGRVVRARVNRILLARLGLTQSPWLDWRGTWLKLVHFVLRPHHRR